MERPGVVLFDFFGTLVTYEADRTALTYERTHALLRAWGADLTHDELVSAWDLASRRVEEATAASLVEHSMRDVAPVFADDVGLDLDQSSVDRLIDVFLAEWEAPVALVEGADDLVRGLAEHYGLGVVSNTNDPRMVPRLLAGFDIQGCFEHVVLSVDHGHRKPHPSIYQAALERFDASPRDAVFVGDSYEADLAGPAAVGMASYLIDPDHAHDVPDENRLDSVLDLGDRLLDGSFP